MLQVPVSPADVFRIKSLPCIAAAPAYPTHLRISEKCKFAAKAASSFLQENVRSVRHDRTMAVLLGHTTALEYWRSLATMQDVCLHDALIGSQDERRRTTNMLQQKLAATQSRQDSLAYLADYPDAHVLTVGRRAYSRNGPSLSHRIVSLPAHSCVQANVHHQAKPLYASTPEFCFLQMAGQLSLEELISLGFELCGTYAIQDEDTIYNAIPLTTPEKLRAFLSRADGLKGVAAARRAVKFVIAGSASPLETALAMFLTLPYSLGGYGIAQPQLNYRIDIPASLTRFVRSRYFLCDLFWPDASLAIEYDSNLAHAGINKTVHDSMRSSVLTALGISVLSVTWPQVKNRRAFDQLARLVAKRTHKRLQYKNPEFTTRHLNLRNKLLYPSSAVSSKIATNLDLGLRNEAISGQFNPELGFL